jgi:ribosomal-protein-alanine N-acetyltransferase
MSDPSAPLPSPLLPCPATGVVMARMTRKDVAEVAALEELAFPDPWDKKTFARELINAFSRTFVCRDADGRLVGYIVYWIAGPEFHILNVATHPEARRKGVARMLINRCVSDALDEGAEFVALEVRTSNAPAKALYQRYGFVTVGIRPRYYKNGEDAEVMLLYLRP